MIRHAISGIKRTFAVHTTVRTEVGLSSFKELILIIFSVNSQWEVIKEPMDCGNSVTYNSMTSLLVHTVAQPTKPRFLPKNLSQLVIFVIELAFT